jgi:hypothetical protein
MEKSPIFGIFNLSNYDCMGKTHLFHWEIILNNLSIMKENQIDIDQ